MVGNHVSNGTPSGDALDFAYLFERHFDALLRYLTRRLGSGAAEDAVADVFVRALRSASRYEARAETPRPWLFGIAANVVADRRRSERRQLRAVHRLAMQQVEGPLSSSAESPLDPALIGALRALKRRDRETVLLIAWGELTYEETAAALGVPVGTVRSRVSRARRQIAASVGRANVQDRYQEMTHHA